MTGKQYKILKMPRNSLESIYTHSTKYLLNMSSMNKYNITIAILALICLVAFISQSMQEQWARERRIEIYNQ